MILVDASGISVSRPDKPLFDDVSITVSSGDRLGIVGLNGCGKSTLLRVLAGEQIPESGVVRFGRDVRVSALAQLPTFEAATAREAIGGEWEGEAVADRLGLAAALDAPIGTLSGGQLRRVALARALVTPSDLLVLDEPTNHLDIDAIAWLEDRIAQHTGGLVLVTHDRHVLDRVTNRVIEIDRGKIYAHDGGYDVYLEARALREEQAAKDESTRRILARKELAWLRRGAPARTAKPKARIETATAIVESTAAEPARAGLLDLYFGTPRLGDVVIELHDVGFSFDGGVDGAAAPLFEGLDLLLDPRERLGIVGANGTGKSTLLDVMAGRREPTTGRVVRGSTVQLGYYDQLGRTLDPTMTVREAVAGPRGEADHRVGSLLEAFWYGTDAQWAPIGLLSGGERRRLQLLLCLVERPNVLLLDEPTNDLDLDTLRTLEDFLETWPGALVVVSHDRAFLERTVADVIVLDQSATVGRRPGGYAAYEAERRAGRRRGSLAEAPRPGPASARRSSPSSGDGGSAPKQRSQSTIRHLVRTAERQMATLSERREQLVGELSTDDHRRLAEVGEQLSAVDAELAAAEEQWMALAAEAEDRGFQVS